MSENTQGFSFGPAIDFNEHDCHNTPMMGSSAVHARAAHGYQGVPFLVNDDDDDDEDVMIVVPDKPAPAAAAAVSSSSSDPKDVLPAVSPAEVSELPKDLVGGLSVWQLDKHSQGTAPDVEFRVCFFSIVVC